MWQLVDGSRVCPTAGPVEGAISRDEGKRNMLAASHAPPLSHAAAPCCSQAKQDKTSFSPVVLVSGAELQASLLGTIDCSWAAGFTGPNSRMSGAVCWSAQRHKQRTVRTVAAPAKPASAQQHVACSTCSMSSTLLLLACWRSSRRAVESTGLQVRARAVAMVHAVRHAYLLIGQRWA